MRGNLDLSIRDYTPSDRDGVIALIIALQRFEMQYATDHATPDRAFGEWYLEHTLESVRENDGAMLVATHDGAPCGMIAGYEVDDPESRSRYFYIAELSVAETMRGQGVGSQLIAAIEDVARRRGHTTAVIGVLIKNTRAHALYDRLGFRDHAVRMRKKL
jgi:ribosomal protein S18 acetylase RimI-like enzyme